VIFVSEKAVTRTSNNAYSLNPVNIVFLTVPGGGSLCFNDGALLTHDLFSNTHCVTAQQITDLSRCYMGFTATEDCFQEDIVWSLAYFENNVDPVPHHSGMI
jgi:hypothetical protein